MKYKLESLAAQPVAFLRRTGAYGPENILVLETVKAWVRSADLPEAPILAVIWDDPSATPPEQCRYDACAVLPPNAPEPEPEPPMQVGTLPGGRTAVFRLPHTAQAVQEAWAGLDALLTQNGLLRDLSRPAYERYRASLARAGFWELCVPVVQ